MLEPRSEDWGFFTLTEVDMEETKINSSIPYYDINLSAYLAYRGIEPVLVKENGRVVFHFPNDTRTHEVMAEYNGNPPVPLLDFIGHLRKLRAKMLTMRG
jgi:hypothetical protein